ncbi:MAG: hypothetical protein ACI90A_001742, partial [Shewanella sp.]
NKASILLPLAGCPACDSICLMTKIIMCEW